MPVERENEVKSENPEMQNCFPIFILSIAKNYNNTLSTNDANYF